MWSEIFLRPPYYRVKNIPIAWKFHDQKIIGFPLISFPFNCYSFYLGHNSCLDAAVQLLFMVIVSVNHHLKGSASRTQRTATRQAEEPSRSIMHGNKQSMTTR